MFFRVCSGSDESTGDPARAPTVIVFVHGLLSDSLTCWLRRSEKALVYWPALVCEDPRLNGISIFLAGYETSMGRAQPGIQDIAGVLYVRLNDQDRKYGRVMDYKRIVFVCHSAGGVVVRQLLVDYSDEFAKHEVGLILLASPSFGSVWAKLVLPFSKLLGNKLAADLAPNSGALVSLHRRFLQRQNRCPIPGIVGLEGRSRFFGTPEIVQRDSGAVYFPYDTYPTTDHSTIAKPAGLKDLPHATLVQFLQNDMGLGQAERPPGTVLYPQNSKPPLEVVRKRALQFPIPQLQPAILLLLAVISLSPFVREIHRQDIPPLRGQLAPDLLFQFHLPNSLASFLHITQEGPSVLIPFVQNPNDWATSPDSWKVRTVGSIASLVMSGRGLAMPADKRLWASAFYDFYTRFQFRLSDPANSFDWYFRLWPYADFLRNRTVSWRTAYKFELRPSASSQKAVSLAAFFCGDGPGSCKGDALNAGREDHPLNCGVSSDSLFTVEAWVQGNRFVYRLHVDQGNAGSCQDNVLIPPIQAPPAARSRFGNVVFGGTDPGGEVQLEELAVGTLWGGPLSPE